MWATRLAAAVLLTLGAAPSSAQMYSFSDETFRPWDLPQVKAYHQADVRTTIATGVSAWSSMVPGDPFGDLAQSTGGDQPALTTSVFPSGRPGIEGDASGDLLAFSANRTIFGEGTMVVVLEWSSTVQGMYWWAQDTNNRDGCSAGAQDDYFIRSGGTNTLLTTGDDCPETGFENVQHTFIVYKDASDNFTIFRQGNDVTAGTPNNSSNWVFRQILSNSTGTTYDSIYGIVLLARKNLQAKYHDDLQAYVDNWSGL